LQDIYNALVEAEASYEDADDDMRQDFCDGNEQLRGGDYVQSSSQYYSDYLSHKADVMKCDQDMRTLTGIKEQSVRRFL